MVSEDSQSIRVASEAFQKAQAQTNVPSELVLSNGIVLKFRPMPPMLLNSITNSIPVPAVPKVWLEDKQREEENPNHPAYLQALQDRQNLITKASMDLIMYACTEVIHVPDNVWGPEDDRWLPIAKIAMMDFDPSDHAQRVLAWFKCYAIATVEDMTQSQMIPLQLAGITEVEVQEAVETFPGSEERGANTGVSPDEQSSNGHHVWDSGGGDGL